MSGERTAPLHHCTESQLAAPGICIVSLSGISAVGLPVVSGSSAGAMFNRCVDVFVRILHLVNLSGNMSKS